MYNNNDYPVGADTPKAPWNEKEPPVKSFDIAVSCSLSKDTVISSRNYDDINGCNQIREPWNEYTSSEYTVEEIISFACKSAKLMLNKNINNIKSNNCLIKMINSCKGWVTDEENVEQV